MLLAASVVVVVTLAAACAGTPDLQPAPTTSATSTTAPNPTAPKQTAPNQTRAGTRPAQPSVRPAPPITIADRGPGTFTRADLTQQAASARGKLLRYDVRVEKGLPFDSMAVAATIQQILNDERSWRGSGDWRFELVDSPADADLHAYLANPKTTDKLCAPLLTRGEVSCQNGRSVVLNAKRWAFGAPAYGRDVAGYRRYLVNHEFGHTLGRQHVGCPGQGRLAPVMMQQTKGLRGCRANSWPSPTRW